MLTLTRRIEALEPGRQVAGTLVLTIEQRERSRFRTELASGETVGVIIERGGPTLRAGDGLADDRGTVYRVEAAPEAVTALYAEDPLLLARAAYHLGNRHTPLEISDQALRYRHDHVLDDMVRGLGLDPVHETAPFQPESGAYGHGGGHGSGHDHHHGHHEAAAHD